MAAKCPRSVVFLYPPDKARLYAEMKKTNVEYINYLIGEERKAKFRELMANMVKRGRPKSNFMKKGNHKLSTKTAIWSIIDVITCPWASYDCLRFCYAGRDRKRNGWYVTLARYARYMMTRRPDFPDLVIKWLRNRVRRTKSVRAVRIHESGDFYSKEYFKKWVMVAEAFPEIPFLAYTKTLPVIDIPRPKNFIIIYSLDRSNIQLLDCVVSKMYKGAPWGISYVYINKDDIPNINKIARKLGAKPHFCPATNPKLKKKLPKHFCGEGCNYCYDPRKSPKFVVFYAH